MSGSEVAFFSISPKQLDEIEKSDKSLDKTVVQQLNNPEKLLASILVANNFINIAIVTVSAMMMEQITAGRNWSQLTLFIIDIVLVTTLILLFGEVLPKIYATNANLAFARMMSTPIKWVSKVFYPLIALLLSSSTITNRFIKKKPNDISVDDLEHALELTRTDVDDDEHKILEGIIKFGNISVNQVMTPRTDTVAFDVETPYEELLQEVVDSGHSRVPIYEDSFDHIKGVLYLKDLLPHKDEKDFDWHSIIREAFFVPENKMIDDLLMDFQERKMHLAIVVDEYGGSSGIVTLEDVIEEIVGEITDEFDQQDVNYTKLDDNNFSFEGKTPLVDLCRIMDLDPDQFEKATSSTHTLAGLVVELAEKIPLKNEKIKFENFTFTVEASDKRKVKQVLVTKHEIEKE